MPWVPCCVTHVLLELSDSASLVDESSSEDESSERDSLRGDVRVDTLDRVSPLFSEGFLKERILTIFHTSEVYKLITSHSEMLLLFSNGRNCDCLRFVVTPEVI